VRSVSCLLRRVACASIFTIAPILPEVTLAAVRHCAAQRSAGGTRSHGLKLTRSGYGAVCLQEPCVELSQGRLKLPIIPGRGEAGPLAFLHPRFNGRSCAQILTVPFNSRLRVWAKCSGEISQLVGRPAGQAVVFLASKVRWLHLIVRGAGLEASMSKYLIDRILALPNVELHTHTEVIALEGDPAEGLTGAVFHNHLLGEEHRCQIRYLFLFGADPNTGWLKGCVELDAKGFVATGALPLPGEAGRGRAPLQLEMGLPGVFAIGDVRSGSTKRVAAGARR
jgi:hypothetical protein